MKKMHYNSAKLTGRLVDGLVYSHTSDKTVYFKGTLAVERTSGTVDFLPVVANERTVAGLPDLTDKTVTIAGQISTCNRPVGNRSRLLVELFAFHIDVTEDAEHDNNVVLRGAVCKAPTFRVTPGGREISDLILAVNRPGGRSSYVPCIVWGSDARKVRDIPVGSQLEVRGRFQSRNYDKQLEGGVCEHRTAYEISASQIVTEDN